MIVPEFNVGTSIQVEYKDKYASYRYSMRVYRVITRPKGTQIVYAKNAGNSASIIFSTGDLKEAQDAIRG